MQNDEDESKRTEKKATEYIFLTFSLYISWREKVTMQSPVCMLEKDPRGTFNGTRGESRSQD